MNSLKSGILIILLAFMRLTATVDAQTLEINKAKAEISELLKKKATVMKTLDKNDPDYDKTVHYNWGSEKNIFVFDDRIEFRHNKKSMIMYFSNLIDYEIYAISNQKYNAGAVVGDFLILLKGSENGKKLAENLIFIQNQIHYQKMEKQYAPQLILFEPIAAKYRELKIKPQVSEEQRKYIVQANSFNEQKDYHKAIELYLKALTVDQTSYPAAYSNLALLSAQVSEFYDAIYYMRKYLMLNPEADDARSAQDKIYAWEAKIGM